MFSLNNPRHLIRIMIIVLGIVTITTYRFVSMRAARVNFKSQSLSMYADGDFSSIEDGVTAFYGSEIDAKSSSTALDLIGLTLNKYEIDIPSSLVGIEFDPGLNERGLANISERFFIKSCFVSLGMEAFSSEAVLASTLIHEITGHCRQSATLISIKNIPSIFGAPRYGDMGAEFDAYDLELKSGIKHTPNWINILENFKNEYEN